MSKSRYGLIGGIAFVAALASFPADIRAQDDPAGVVVEPGDVTSAPTDEGAAAEAGGGFDTPADAIQTEAPDLQPQPMTVEPNN